jgi:TBC1 domain family member 20
MLLLQADEALAQYITKAGVLPYFALSWYITWFAHEVQSLPQIARLFDLFMASHPLMPLYVGAAAMKVSVSRAYAHILLLPVEKTT